MMFLLLPFLFMVASANPTTLTVTTTGLDAVVSAVNVVDLYGYEFKLVFDSAIIEVADIEFTGLNDPSRVFYCEFGENFVHVAVCSLYPNLKGVDGNIALATIHFAGQTEFGVSPLQFEMSILADSDANPICHGTLANSIILGDNPFIIEKALDAENKLVYFMC